MFKRILRAFRADPRLRAVVTKVFAVVFVCAAVGSAFVAYWSPSVYLSTASIRLHTDPPPVGRKGADDPRFVTTQLRILTSTSLFNSVNANLNLQHVLALQSGEPDWSLDKTFMALSQKVGVTHKSGTSGFAVSVKNADPDMAAQIANAIIGSFREYHRQLWKQLSQLSDREMQVVEADTILDLAKSSPDSVVRTKLEIFSMWALVGTLLALVAGGGGALICLLTRPHCPDRGSLP